MAIFGKRVLQVGVILMIVMLFMHLLLIKETVQVFWYRMWCRVTFFINISNEKIPVSLAGTAAGINVTFQQISIASGVRITGGLFLQIPHVAAMVTSLQMCYQRQYFLSPTSVLFVIQIVIH